MRSSNQAEIQRAFTRQADGFESDRMHFSRKAYLDDLAAKIGVSGEDAVLEVAAGTCACGRAIAPSAGWVVCLDMTPAMLSVGKAEAEKAALGNMTFVLGDAAGLPFLDDSFDVVLSRLAFHHFPEVEGPFAEMVRVLRPGGRLALIDMEAAEPSLRETEDGIERERDPSHVRNLSRDEMLALFEKLRARIPGLVLRTSLITGLPGEGEAELEELCVFLRETKIERAGVFPFSPEEGTRAAQMDHVDMEEARRRAELVVDVQSDIIDAYNESVLGTEREVLCEGFDSQAQMHFGRSYAESPDIDGRIWFDADREVEPGTFVTVRLTGVMDGELTGELAEE